jgi:thiamine biosynthesis lipoprotein
VKDHQPDRSVSVDRGDGCWRGQFQAMASPCEVLCETGDRGDAIRLTTLAATEAWRIEDKFSRYLPGNIVERINCANGESVELDAETAHLIDFSATLYELSDGRFDITSGVLRRVWTFDGSDNLPSAVSVANILEETGWHKVSWISPTLQMPAGMQIDLGGVGKEYAVDRAAEQLRDATSVSCLINFGGDLAVTARPRHRDGWKVGIQALDAAAAAADRLLTLQIGALATSGDSQRFLLKDNVRYGHILDAKTGWPVPDAPRSITVAAATCTQAGMLSTFAMLEGDGAEAFLDAQGVRYWCNR